MSKININFQRLKEPTKQTAEHDGNEKGNEGNTNRDGDGFSFYARKIDGGNIEHRFRRAVRNAS